MYHHPIYDALSTEYGWHREEAEFANHSAGGSTKRRMFECLWTNFDPPVGR
jgi:hypothetical protein